MKISAFDTAQVTFKSRNRRWEACFSIDLGHKIVDVIRNMHGNLEVVKFVGKQMFRVPFSLTWVL